VTQVLDDTKAGEMFDTWLQEKLKDAVPCVWKGCDAEAEWKVTALCCGKTYLFCPPHKEEAKARFARMSRPLHQPCKTMGPTVRLDAVKI